MPAHLSGCSDRRLSYFTGKMGSEHCVYGHFLYKGIPLTELIHWKEKLAAIENYDQFRDDDVFILTYPKSGGSLVISSHEQVTQGRKIKNNVRFSESTPKLFYHKS